MEKPSQKKLLDLIELNENGEYNDFQWVTKTILKIAIKTVPTCYDDHHRIDWSLLKPFLLNNKDVLIDEEPENDNWIELKCENLKRDIAKKDFELELKKGEYSKNTEFVEYLRKLEAEQRRILIHQLVHHAPTYQVGLDEAKLKDYNMKIVEEVINKLKEIEIKYESNTIQST